LFKTTLRKMSFLVALFIAFFLSLAAPSAAMAEVETGWSVDTQKHGLSAVYAEPVNFSSARQKDGAKDTVLGVYSVLPLIGRSPDNSESAATGIAKDYDRAIVSGYKDRPGWQM